MSETSDRYRNVAARLTERVRAVRPDDWDNPSPCEEWTARGVLDHLIESSAYFLGRAGVGRPAGPSVTDDPMGAWEATWQTMQAALDDPDVAGRAYDTPMGPATLEQTMGQYGVGDVLIHTWDLSRATGLDESLDPDEVHRLVLVMEPNDEMLRQSGMFGPRVSVPEGADEQTRLIAFSGRQP